MSVVQHFSSISGGADSLATALLAIERRDRRGMNLRFINADLGGHESQITHDYIGYLERALDIKIERVRANFDAEFAQRRATIQQHWSVEKRRKEHTPHCKTLPLNMRIKCNCRVRVSPPVAQEIIDRAKELLVPTGEPFLDLCMLKGRFPSRTAQFCTERLKLEPINAITHPILREGTHIISWIGEMAEESVRRAKKPPLQRIRQPEVGAGQLVLYRPILRWTKADNFALARRHGVAPNPLYKMGFSRVGCMLCINAEKAEVAQADQRFPEVITRIAEWQRLVALVSRRQSATFFSGTEAEPLKGDILNAVQWAKTTRGGKQFDLLQRLARSSADADGAICQSAYGLCE